MQYCIPKPTCIFKLQKMHQIALRMWGRDDDDTEIKKYKQLQSKDTVEYKVCSVYLSIWADVHFMAFNDKWLDAILAANDTSWKKAIELKSQLLTSFSAWDLTLCCIHKALPYQIAHLLAHKSFMVMTPCELFILIPLSKYI